MIRVQLRSRRSFHIHNNIRIRLDIRTNIVNRRIGLIVVNTHFLAIRLNSIPSIRRRIITLPILGLVCVYVGALLLVLVIISVSSLVIVRVQTMVLV